MPEQKTIIITGTTSTNSNIEKVLLKYNARVISFPLIKSVAIEPNKELLEIFNCLSSFEWVIFTSKNGVKCFLNLIKNKENIPLIACIGNKTRTVLKEYNLTPSFVGSGKDSQTFLQEWISSFNVTHKNILLVQGELADNQLLEALTKYDCNVERVNVYRTEFTGSQDKENIQRIINNDFDYICFSSPSAFQSFQKLNIIIDSKKIVCIGKTTANFIQSQGITPGLTAITQSAEGLADIIYKKEKLTLNQ